MTESELLWHLTFGAFERRFPTRGEFRSYAGPGDITLDQAAELCLHIPVVKAIVSAIPGAMPEVLQHALSSSEA
jgi:hypothetical protein